MDQKELVEAALRILVAWSGGAKPASADVASLREAFPSWAGRPDDELACRIVQELSGRVFGEVSVETRDPTANGQNAA